MLWLRLRVRPDGARHRQSGNLEGGQAMTEASDKARMMAEIWSRVYLTSFLCMIFTFVLSYTWHDRWLWWFAWVLLPVGIYAWWRKERYRRKEFWLLSEAASKQVQRAWWLGLEKDR